MKVLTLIFVIFHPVFCSAYCGKVEFHMVFANGMFNSQLSAAKSYWALASRAGVGSEELPIVYSTKYLAYNTDENMLSQAYEVFRQKTRDEMASFWSYLDRLSSAPDWFKEYIAIQQSKTVAEEVVKNRDLQKQIKLYKNILENKKAHIVTVAHSQGNFFTNFAFEYLAENSSDKLRLNMISVATPASRVFGHGGYVNLKSDCVVARMPGALKANTENTPVGLCDHEFISNYLDGSDSGEKINTAIDDAIQTTERNGKYALDSKPILLWRTRFIRNKYQKSLDPHQCLSIRLLKSSENQYWEHVACERRGLLGFKAALSHCLNMKNGKKVKENLCPQYFGIETAAIDDIYSGLFSDNNSDGIFEQHKECQWDKETFLNKVLSDELVAKALKFMENPWVEIDLK